MPASVLTLRVKDWLKATKRHRSVFKLLWNNINVCG
jgi:hypothetical protein